MKINLILVCSFLALTGNIAHAKTLPDIITSICKAEKNNSWTEGNADLRTVVINQNTEIMVVVNPNTPNIVLPFSYEFDIESEASITIFKWYNKAWEFKLKDNGKAVLRGKVFNELFHCSLL